MARTTKEATKQMDMRRRDNLMGGEVEKWIRVCDMPKDQICAMAEIGMSTLNDRLRNPSEFRVKELRIIADLAGVDVAQLVN